MREQKGVVELSGCMEASPSVWGCLCESNGEELAIRLFELEAIPFHFFDFLIYYHTCSRVELNYT